MVGVVLFSLLVFDGSADVVEQTGRLSPGMFGASFDYLPLKDSLGSAIEAAMQSSKNIPQSAIEATVWLVLQVTLTAEQFVAYLTHFRASPPGPDGIRAGGLWRVFNRGAALALG